MNIKRMVLAYVKTRGGWSEITKPVRLGPATCGQPKNGYKSECRTAHAYAQAVGKEFDEEGDVHFSFIYDRPCNAHESAWGPDKRREFGLSV